jgi:3-hydroxyisobutyrate dehydrogenase-like beta-hydroxyacid dehydrogenase
MAELTPQTIAVECSTLTPAWVSSLATEMKRRGARFLDAPVVGSRPQAEAGALAFLVGGSAEDVERVGPVLAALGGAVHHLGPSPSGTVAKLAVNALFGVQLACVAELLGLGRQALLDMEKFVSVLGTLPVMSPAARGAAEAMLGGKFAPQFPIALVAKDFSYALSTASVFGAALPITARAKEVFEQGVSRGLASENITAIAKLYR